MTDALDPFALLGLPRRFDVDRNAVQSAYLRRSAALHPDRVTDPLQRADAAAAAARINDARAMLLDDEQRANHLLHLLGGPSKETDDALPDGFLMEILEKREELEEALASATAAGRAASQQWADEQRASHVASVAQLFERFEQLRDPETLRAIRKELNAWRYIERMMEALRA